MTNDQGSAYDPQNNAATVLMVKTPPSDGSQNPMIVLIGKALIQPGKRDEFLALISESAVVSRQEPGNVSYGWFESAETENLFMVVEEWESEAAMGAHQSDHGKAFVQALLTLIVEPPQLYRYDTLADNPPF